MKYIEELCGGDCFSHNNIMYVLTKDFKSNGSRSCYSLVDGSSKWFNANDIVNETQIYTLNEGNTIAPVKIIEKEKYNV